jgi:Tfp pilus assembly protein PilX
MSCRQRHRGTVYLLVLGACLIATIIAVGALTTGRAQSRTVRINDDAAAAQLAARSGLELARNWINSDANWRSNRTNGVWATNLAIGSAKVSIEAIDPLDGNLANHQYDPVTVTCIATYGQARQSASVTLYAKPTPLPVLAYAAHTNGQMRIRSGNRLKMGTASASTNGEFRVDGAFEGNATAGTNTSSGSIAGEVTTGGAARTLPGTTMINAYTALGTSISPGGTMSNKLLTAAINPWGATNSDGVYVVSTSSDFTLKSSRIVGTLVILCPGRTVTIDQSVLIQPGRSDFPSLIVDGNLSLQYTSSTALSEVTAGVNFNPPGAAYNGVTNTNLTDTYPSEIQGLVYATGTITWLQPSTVRGALIAASSASNDAFSVQSTAATVLWDGSLYANPPQWFSTVQMVVQSNSYTQVLR